MGKIDQRRAKTAKANIDNKAVLAEGTAPKSEFPYKKILIAVLAVVAVIACALLILNAVIDNYSGKLRTDGAKPVNEATVVGKIGNDDFLYDKELLSAQLDKYGFLDDAIITTYENFANNSGINVQKEEGILNFVVTVTGDVYGDSNNKLATAMLVSIKDGKLTLVRMNTTTFVAIPGLAVGPLYDSYRFGGAALVAKTIQENYGIAINGYFDLPIKAFIEAAIMFEEDKEINLDGKAFPITIDAATTAKSLFEYIRTSEDKEALTKALIDTVVGNFADANVLDLRKLVDDKDEKPAPFGSKSGIVSYVSRDDFGTIIKLILSNENFNASKNVITFGLGETSKPVDPNGTPNHFYSMTMLVDYSASIKELQKALGYTVAAE